MVKVKEMPYSEKCTKVLDSIKLDDTTLSFIEKHLGDQAVDKL